MEGHIPLTLNKKTLFHWQNLMFILKLYTVQQILRDSACTKYKCIMYAHVLSDPLHFAVSLFLVEGKDLSPQTGLSVTVRVNPLCRNAVYPVLASFGIQMADGCSVQQNDTDSAKLGNSVTLTVDPDNIPLGTDQNYCVVISSNGEIGRWLHTCVHNSDIIIVLGTMYVC